MAYNITPLLGADLTNIVLASDITAGRAVPAVAIGTQVWGNDGKRYVYAKANASITASTATCAISASTFLVTATTGAYTSPATNMVTGDYGWFSAASV